jgi:hypothetical protein
MAEAWQNLAGDAPWHRYTKNEILEKVRYNRYSREETYAYITAEVRGVSAITV